jgi:hypothetical protein
LIATAEFSNPLYDTSAGAGKTARAPGLDDSLYAQVNNMKEGQQVAGPAAYMEPDMPGDARGIQVNPTYVATTGLQRTSSNDASGYTELAPRPGGAYGSTVGEDSYAYTPAEAPYARLTGAHYSELSPGYVPMGATVHSQSDATYGMAPNASTYATVPATATYATVPVSSSYASMPASSDYGIVPASSSYASVPSSAAYGTVGTSAQYSDVVDSSAYALAQRSP